MSSSVLPRRVPGALILAASLFFASATGAQAKTLYLSPNGSDYNAGTITAPLRTLNKANSSVAAGDTVLMRAGTYGARGTTTRITRSGTASAPITFARYPGDARPTILGHMKISASYTRFRELLFDGPTGRVKTPTTDNPNGEQVQVAIDGATTYGVEISNSEIRDSLWHAGIYLANAYNVRLVNNWIHDNGNSTDPAQANLCHGIYFSSGSGLVGGNLISHNVARGVQLYPSPGNVVVEENTIVRNGKAGIQFANATTNSVAVNNVVALNGDTGIRSASLTGTGNRAFNNLIWSNSANSNLGGIQMFGNTTVSPRFLGATDYRLASGSPAIDAADPGWSVGVDLMGTSRTLGAGPDLGSYESG